ncbi:MAG: universal stress protein [Cyclobacteriaceae bacterium]|nr:universal stress protein [Cyclobacteriaceae bacterium]
MYKFNKILVALDLSAIDSQLIESACTICDIFPPKEIIFINVIRDFDFPEELLKEFPGLLEKALEERKATIEKQVEKHFTCGEVKIHIVIKQGQATKEIMKYSAEKKVDLIVLGRKNEKKGGGTLISRLTRRASCSLLVIPKDTKLKFDKILVPIDFSSYSRMALEKALTIARNLKYTPKIITQNVYHVPSGYHYTGKTYEEFSETMKENAKVDYQKFTSPLNLKNIKIEATYTLDKDDDVIGDINKKAKSIKADVIVIGAKGRTATAAIFIGSKAEKLIQQDDNVPLMVIRPKGKTAGILEYLKEI